MKHQIAILPKGLLERAKKSTPAVPSSITPIRPLAPGEKGLAAHSTRSFIQKGAPAGEWPNALFKAAKDLQEQGHSFDETIALLKKPTGFLDYNDIKQIRSAFSKAPKYAPRIPDPRFGSDEEDKEQFKPPFLADRWLKENGLEDKIRFWNGDAYIYTGKHYLRQTEDDIRNELVNWCRDDDGLKRLLSNRLVGEMLTSIKAITAVNSTVNPPEWLNGEKLTVIALENGLLKIDDLLNNTIQLIPHSPEYFSLNSLPYSYDPAADCPIFKSILEQCQPDLEVRNFIQEWLGYNLVPDVSQGKFVLMYGEGSNSKSVLCVVHRGLLGASNISALGLEGFDPARTFPLAATQGKLANIVEELNEVDKAAEGMIKQYVTGGEFMVERKGRDPFTLYPTARLTFASNFLPRFTDRSDGLWRRLIIIPFNVQITDEAKQNKNYITAKWWEKSGELPGIFNWAIEGLRRLRARGYFLEPKIAAAFKKDFKESANPARVFLEDNYEACEHSEPPVFKRDIYEAYSNYAQELGQRPLAENTFSVEVKRSFKMAKSTNDKIRVNGQRGRAWFGIRLKEDTLPAQVDLDPLAGKFVPK